jgi:hypothetical protein
MYEADLHYCCLLSGEEAQEPNRSAVIQFRGPLTKAARMLLELMGALNKCAFSDFDALLSGLEQLKKLVTFPEGKVPAQGMHSMVSW